jgi:hypothetical protein
MSNIHRWKRIGRLKRSIKIFIPPRCALCYWWCRKNEDFHDLTQAWNSVHRLRGSNEAAEGDVLNWGESGEARHSLKVIRTHVSIASISMQTLQTPRRSLLTRIEVLSRTFTGPQVSWARSRLPPLLRITIQPLSGYHLYLSNLALVLGSHGVSSGASLEAMILWGV